MNEKLQYIIKCSRYWISAMILIQECGISESNRSSLL